MKRGNSPPEPDLNTRLEIMCRQVELTVKYKGERTGMSEARRQCAYYLKGIPHAAALRDKCGKLSTLADLRELCGEVVSFCNE